MSTCVGLRGTDTRHWSDRLVAIRRRLRIAWREWRFFSDPTVSRIPSKSPFPCCRALYARGHRRRGSDGTDLSARVRGRAFSTQTRGLAGCSMTYWASPTRLVITASIPNALVDGGRRCSIPLSWLGTPAVLRVDGRPHWMGGGLGGWGGGGGSMMSAKSCGDSSRDHRRRPSLVLATSRPE